MDELKRKVLRETKHCLDAEISVVEMSVNEEFEAAQNIFSTEKFPDMKPHTEQ